MEFRNQRISTGIVKNGLLLSFFLPLLSIGQTAEEVIANANKAVSKIKQGQYNATHALRFAGEDKVYKTTSECHFKKVSGDTLYPVHFWFNWNITEDLSDIIIYNGKERITCSGETKRYTIADADKYAWDLANFKNGETFHAGIIDSYWKPLPPNQKVKDKSAVLEMLEDETIAGKDCYHIRSTELLSEEEKKDWDLGYINDLWIDKKTYVTVQYEQQELFLDKGDTLHTYYFYRLDRFNLDEKANLELMSETGIPKDYVLKPYESLKPPSLLEVGAIAPDWSLEDLNGLPMKLSDMKGKLVLMDFFFQGCLPCREAMPVLQEIYETYKDKGLVVVGVNPIDKRNPETMASFLDKMGVTYPTVYEASDVAVDYRVAMFPTMYFVGKDGKIVDIDLAFGRNSKDELIKIIEENL